MAGRLEGKVAFITGAARGQGRSHAVRLAEEGADIIAIDICQQMDSVPYQMATPEDLAQTVKEVEALDRRIVATQADVRNAAALKKAVEKGVAQLGHLDIVVANAGIFSFGLIEDIDTQKWDEMIAVNLTGVWNTVQASIPALRANGSGSIIITSSTAGLWALPTIGHYVVSKHGTVGIMRSAAVELAKDNIRANSVHPTNVDTHMIHNQGTYNLFAPDLPEEQRTKEILRPRFEALNSLPVPWVDARDISNAVLWLASDEARYVTGLEVRVDAGSMLKH
ncbi:mycofactocin-coupled SDR family oxidoreductase [Streptomyces brasiliensis]|uniref:Short-chain type dehydrogenase/reductase n=1 Tax=Streptomyces brasiliensis TaxID=1954 RepID=A0A917UIN9_9ACTN|nr:mycofactocin-coupled SDR family oxidoreductase [Streptomyces brasiliensis]GGJ60462.1 putative short-chain type dehydrogenase/reductase [Streptomyces brasiliensis]